MNNFTLKTKQLRPIEDTSGKVWQRREFVFSLTKSKRDDITPVDPALQFSLNRATQITQMLQEQLRTRGYDAEFQISLITDQEPVHFIPVLVKDQPIDLRHLEQTESDPYGREGMFVHPDDALISYLVIRILN